MSLVQQGLANQPTNELEMCQDLRLSSLQQWRREEPMRRIDMARAFGANGQVVRTLFCFGCVANELRSSKAFLYSETSRDFREWHIGTGIRHVPSHGTVVLLAHHTSLCE